MFPDLKITNEGKAMMLKVVEGEPLKFTRIVLGNGNEPTDQDLLVYVQNECASADIVSFERTGSIAKLHWALNTEDVQNNFDWTEYGLYATSELDGNGDPVPGTDKLFSYAYNEGKSQPISSNTSITPIQIEADINIAIGTSENINAVVSEYSAYASKQAFQEHLADNNNPHGVNAEDVGLGNVNNTSDTDAVPLFVEAERLESVASGETASILWGKVKRLFTAFLNHISNRNAHGTTASDVGAAPSVHTHSATDINSGVLNVQRGGTGVSSLANLLTALNLYDLQIKSISVTGTGNNAKTKIRFKNGFYIEFFKISVLSYGNIPERVDFYYERNFFKYPPVVFSSIQTGSNNMGVEVQYIDCSGYSVVVQNKTGYDQTNWVNVLVVGWTN